MKIEKEIGSISAFNMAGLFSLSIRLVVGWTYFSALWRRLVLADKLNPDAPGYIGEKFNHFLPHSLGIKPIIEYLITHPDLLWWAMVVFTIIEGIVGLFIMLGLFTRLNSIGIFMLAMGILLGSGWIGTTCLDEWQIGILGIAAGFTLFLSGSGGYSLDQYLINKNIPVTKRKIFSWIGSGPIPLRISMLKKTVLIGSFAILSISLFTNQYFHGGLWGPLHNKSVKPMIEISEAKIDPHEGMLSFAIYRTEGVDVYGSFLIGITLSAQNRNTIISKGMDDLAAFPEADIKNEYIAKIKPGKHSLVVPLGAKATITIRDPDIKDLSFGTYTLTLLDINGSEFVETIAL